MCQGIEKNVDQGPELVVESDPSVGLRDLCGQQAHADVADLPVELFENRFQDDQVPDRLVNQATDLSDVGKGLLALLERYWGYRSFRPLQAEAMLGCVAERDSVVVLPTGAGKSLCFQLPALWMDGFAIVVSPLISLMKDQVDALRARGIAAAYVNSSMASAERQAVIQQVSSGKLKLLYVAPERLVLERTIEFLKDKRISFFAIDEAHCVSAWGQDFRPEYRQLGILKREFPHVAIHAFTATASPRVREDIIAQLGLKEPEQLLGSVDRSNLFYRVLPVSDRFNQVCRVLQRYPKQSGIIYCNSRKDTELLADKLKREGFSVGAYHAGMSDSDRKRTQEAFLADRLKVVIATVAFGMGIDKPNVRFVLHYEMSQSLEHYLQESGRAGRDGLPAECLLLYRPADRAVRFKLMEKDESAAKETAMQNLMELVSYCHGSTCRRQIIAGFFGEEFGSVSCGACDRCLGHQEKVTEGALIAQKIISCVLRVHENFGAKHIVDILLGKSVEKVRKFRHDQLSTFGLLRGERPEQIEDWIDQLVAVGLLGYQGVYSVVQCTLLGRKWLRSPDENVILFKRPKDVAIDYLSSWDPMRGIDAEFLRDIQARMQQANCRESKKQWVVSKAWELCRKLPSERKDFAKALGFAEDCLPNDIAEWLTWLNEEYDARGLQCREFLEFQDEFQQVIHSAQKDTEARPTQHRASMRAIEIFPMLDRGEPLTKIAEEVGKSLRTISDYLIAYIEQREIGDAATWVNDEKIRAIELAMDAVGEERLKSIFDRLGGDISYDDIKIVRACRLIRNGKPSLLTSAGVESE
jgi:ATP-dependent DNA helicase RecQ